MKVVSILTGTIAAFALFGAMTGAYHQLFIFVAMAFLSVVSYPRKNMKS